ncbi:Rho termination factor N-terminal domain-containing protein [Marinobacter adhaerens]|uniref:Rho termination factor N-terminal domain-containing protein n=2 Tax=Marinobacter adhaerens TaxID=1033846 RepID=A0ABX8ILF0_9GAMM|nr:Rho termination factor N-terminal domain-containing protein [Marinobacter adhaerens]ADP96433.1 protein containing Rho termination factor, N-terminal domain [Marinobacter adhaerens HP15]QWV14423.1 Rho termination factor N-terminal domain-containing protein [Marinobacter adhaerens]
MSKKTISLQCTSAFFVKGEMITKDKIVHGVPEADALNLIRRGKAKKVEAEEDGAEAPALKDLTVAELRDVAKEYDIEGAADMKKADLVAAIEKLESEED